MNYQIEHLEDKELYTTHFFTQNRFGYKGWVTDEFISYADVVDYLKMILSPGDTISGVNLTKQQLAGLENLVKK